MDKKEVKAYNLINQDRVIRGRMPVLEIIYERFIRSFRVNLSNYLKEVSTVSLITTDLIKYGEFSYTLPIPSFTLLLKNKQGQRVIVVLEEKLVYSIIDKLCGGSDRPCIKIEGKEFTTLETNLMKQVSQVLIKDYNEAWKDVFEMGFELERIEFNPQFIGLTHSSDVVIATVMEVEFEHSSGAIIVVIPYNVLSPIKDKLQNTVNVMNKGVRNKIDIERLKSLKFSNETFIECLPISIKEARVLDKGDFFLLTNVVSDKVNNKVMKQYKIKEGVVMKEKEGLVNSLEGIPLKLEVKLGQAVISGKEVMELTTGSVIELDRYAGEELEIYIQGVLVATGEVVVVNDKYGVRITEVKGK